MKVRIACRFHSVTMAFRSHFILSTFVASLTIALLATSNRAFAQEEDTEPNTFYYENAPVSIFCPKSMNCR